MENENQVSKFVDYGRLNIHYNCLNKELCDLKKAVDKFLESYEIFGVKHLSVFNSPVIRQVEIFPHQTESCLLEVNHIFGFNKSQLGEFVRGDINGISIKIEDILYRVNYNPHLPYDK